MQMAPAQQTVILTKTDGSSEVFRLYEDINLSSKEYPRYLLFSLEGQMTEIQLQSSNTLHTWRFNGEPELNEFLEILFPETKVTKKDK